MAPSAPNPSAPGSESEKYERTPTGETIADQLSIEEHGRHYNVYREGKYLLPNDGEEQDRLDLQHYLWKGKLDGRLHLAPIAEPTNVLDIGTGTGIWAKQFAREYPGATVTGTDLSLIQPKETMPTNCSFIREDSEEDWVFDKPFDFIHWRMMVSCFNDHEAMIYKVHDNLLPGGWAEFHEWGCELIGADESAENELRSSALGEWVKRAIAGGAALGRDFQAPLKYKKWMTEAGFVDVVQKQFLTPVNSWPLTPHDKLLGKWASADWVKLVPATTKITQASGMAVEDIPAFQKQVLECLTRESMRVYCPTYVIYGRKAAIAV